MSNPLRKAAEMALEALEWNYGTDLCDIENCMAWLDKMNATIPALRQALAQPEQEFVGACVTCGAPKSEWLVDAVNMSRECVDETAKREHEPYPEGDVVGPCICGSWPGGKCLKCKRIEPPKREWVGLTEEERQEIIKQEVHWTGIAIALEAKLREKNT